jgi:hypothetical protein
MCGKEQRTEGGLIADSGAVSSASNCAMSAAVAWDARGRNRLIMIMKMQVERKGVTKVESDYQI